MTDLAEASDTSCSPDLPPKTTATLIFRFAITTPILNYKAANGAKDTKKLTTPYPNPRRIPGCGFTPFAFASGPIAHELDFWL